MEYKELMVERIVDVEISDVVKFKKIIELLKDILKEVNISFIKDKGMQIIAMNEKKTEIVNLVLYSKDFSKFECCKSIKIGVDIGDFYKLIKYIDKNSSLKFYIKEENINILYINIKNKTIKNCELNLLETDNSDKMELSLDNDIKLTMLSNDFYNICKEMNGMTEYLGFKIKENINIEGCGSIGKINFILDEVKMEKNSDIEQIEERYEINDILIFSKFYGLSENINIYLKKESPIILHYNIDNMGNLFLYITPNIN